jgi:hypothetical protein
VLLELENRLCCLEGAAQAFPQGQRPVGVGKDLDTPWSLISNISKAVNKSTYVLDTLAGITSTVPSVLEQCADGFGIRVIELNSNNHL